MDIVPVNPLGTLFVSGAIEDWQAIRERGIDTIVDMDGDVDPGIPEAPNSTLYVYHPILDDDACPTSRRIEALGRLVAELVASGHRVLVHCRMGLNRSVLVIATALTYLGMTGEQALGQRLLPGREDREPILAVDGDKGSRVPLVRFKKPVDRRKVEPDL